MKYNHRDAKGRYVKKFVRDIDGKFMKEDKCTVFIIPDSSLKLIKDKMIFAHLHSNIIIKMSDNGVNKTLNGKIIKNRYGKSQRQVSILIQEI